MLQLTTKFHLLKNVEKSLYVSLSFSYSTNINLIHLLLSFSHTYYLCDDIY